jgi:hypothetical protein
VFCFSQKLCQNVAIGFAKSNWSSSVQLKKKIKRNSKKIKMKPLKELQYEDRERKKKEPCMLKIRLSI